MTRFVIIEADSAQRAVHARRFARAIGGCCVAACGSVAAARQPAPPAAAFVLLDLGAIEPSASACLHALQARWPESTIILLSEAAAPETVVDALAAGADACLQKSDSAASWRAALAALGRGESPLPGHIARQVIRRLQTTHRPIELSPGLTPREQDILRHLAFGQPYKQIARSLAISLDTVRTHIRRLYHKLGVNSRHAALRQAPRQPEPERPPHP